MISAPKIFAAVLVILTARGSNGRFSCGQSSRHNWPSSRSDHSIHMQPSRLVNSLLQDPWLDRYHLWHNPFSWGHLIPWSALHHPWRTELSFLGPSLSVMDGSGFPALSAGLCNHKCQEEIDEPPKTGTDDGMPQRNDDSGSQGAWQKPDDLDWPDEFLREKEHNRRESEHQQRREQQRLKEEAERDMHWEEYRMQEERRIKQRDQEIKRKGHRQYREETLNDRPRKRADESQTQKEWGRHREQDASDARRQYMDKRHPHQKIKTPRTNHHRDNHQNSGNGFRKVQIGTLNIPGYTSDDLSVTASDNKLLVGGRHICGCHEDCTEREFQRSFELPRNVDPGSLEARPDEDIGLLTISGNQFTNARFPPPRGLTVSIERHGSTLKQPRNVDSSCGGRRTGFKLRKINKRTGRIVDLDDLPMAAYDRTFEDEVDEDGVTMEVVD